MSVVLSVEDTGVCRKQVTVEVPADVVDEETRKVVRAFAQQADFPGFRKGKVPPEVVRRRFREEIDQQMVERLVPRYWEEAREELGIEPFGQPQLQEVDDLEAGEPLRFKASVEVRPEVELGDLDDLEVPERDAEPSEDDVDAALEDVRRQVGGWTGADRPAARGDRVTVHIVEEGHGGDDADDGEDQEPVAEAVEGAEPVSEDAAEPDAEEGGEGEEGDTVQIEVGDENVWEELSLAVTGLSAGQGGHFTRRPQDEEGSPRNFRIRVEEVEERELPPLDDDLASQVGDFESVDDLREAMAQHLRQQRRAESDQKRRAAVLEQLRERHPVGLPEGAVREETQSLLQNYAQDMAQRGVDPSQAGLDWNQLGEQFEPHARKQLHDRLLLDAVADREELEATPQEVQAALASIARSQNATVDQVREALGDRMAGLASQIRREKALKRLLGELDEEEDGAGAEESAAGEGSEERPETAGAEATEADEPAEG